jgi:hypothetical protein
LILFVGLGKYLLCALKIILGKDSLNEFCALPRVWLWMFLQKMTHGDQTLLQELELAPLDNIELGIINVTFIDPIEIMIQLTEVIDPRRL